MLKVEFLILNEGGQRVADGALGAHACGVSPYFFYGSRDSRPTNSDGRAAAHPYLFGLRRHVAAFKARTCPRTPRHSAVADRRYRRLSRERIRVNWCNSCKEVRFPKAGQGYPNLAKALPQGGGDQSTRIKADASALRNFKTF
jgi:hypothetical protein